VLDRADTLTNVGAGPEAVRLSSRTPIPRVLAAGVTVVILMIGAVGVSVWQSETSASLAGVAITDQKQVATAQSGRDSLFDQASLFATNRPLTPSQRTQLSAAQRSFTAVVAVDLVKPGALDSSERKLLALVVAADDEQVALERAVKSSLGDAERAAALQRLRRQQQVVDRRLDAFVADNSREAAASQAQSNTAHRDARTIALAAGGLAVLLGISLLAYTLRLLTSYFDRVGADGELLEQRMRDVEDARIETLQRLARAAEYRDDDTLHHTERVGQLVSTVAERLGLEPETIELMELAAPLHDVGKLGVSDTILLKPGRLTTEERELMKRHTTIGAAILAGSRFPVLRLGAEIALSHHERWDGTGYPSGLAGEAIPLSARIVGIADVFDALTHDRPYKQAWTCDEALAEIAELSGKQFDPRVATAFLSLDHHPVEEALAHGAAGRAEEQDGDHAARSGGLAR
jgi:HD-GYP domain-containing protein (c-di-GMP phosphodiesterase class II)